MLQVEFDGINGALKEYTGDYNIKNYLSKLKFGMETIGCEIVKYSLEKIISWYDGNIHLIAEYIFYKRGVTNVYTNMA